MLGQMERFNMKTFHGLLAVSLASLAVMGCGSGKDTTEEPVVQPTAEATTPSLGTANGETIDDVDVKMNPNMQHSAEEMTGAEEIKEQRPETE